MGSFFSRAGGVDLETDSVDDQICSSDDSSPSQNIRQALCEDRLEEATQDLAQKISEEVKVIVYKRASEQSRNAKAILDKNLSQLESEKKELEGKLLERDCEISHLKSQLYEQQKIVEIKTQELQEKEDALNKEKEKVENEKRDILGIGAPAYQARKMFGDTVPGDITHSDVSSKFSEFFKYYIRNLPKLNPNISSDEVKERITPFFQDAFKISCQHAFQLIQEQLWTLFQDPSEVPEEHQSSFKTKEEQVDTTRAYSLLLYHANVKEKKAEIIEELKKKVGAIETGLTIPDEMITRAATVTWEMATLVPPAISCTPRVYSNAYNEQRNSYWKVKNGPYELVYYRPVMFFGCDGHVGVTGQVGNRACASDVAVNWIEEDEEDNDDGIPQTESSISPIVTEDVSVPVDREASNKPDREILDETHPVDGEASASVDTETLDESAPVDEEVLDESPPMDKEALDESHANEDDAEIRKFVEDVIHKAVAKLMVQDIVNVAKTKSN